MSSYVISLTGIYLCELKPKLEQPLKNKAFIFDQVMSILNVKQLSMSFIFPGPKAITHSETFYNFGNFLGMLAVWTGHLLLPDNNGLPTAVRLRDHQLQWNMNRHKMTEQ